MSEKILRSKYLYLFLVNFEESYNVKKFGMVMPLGNEISGWKSNTNYDIESSNPVKNREIKRCSKGIIKYKEMKSEWDNAKSLPKFKS